MPVESPHPIIDVQPNGQVSIWSLADGTAVSVTHGPDGATATVILRAGELEVKLEYQGTEWKQLVTYKNARMQEIPTITPEQPAVLFKRPRGRPRTRPAKAPRMTFDQAVGATS